MNQPPKYIYVIVSQTGIPSHPFKSNVLAKRMCPNGCYVVKYLKVDN